MKILLEEEEICRELCGDKFVEKFKPLGCAGCSPKQHYDLPKAQLIKVADYIETLPTDGWDKWHYYNKDLAEKIREEL